MTFKTTLAALALTVLPALAAAAGCTGAGHSSETAMSCAEGMVMDPETNTCVPLTTG